MGGNTDQGIMSGVVPRQGYQNGDLARDAEERKKIMMELAGQRPDRSMSDFWIDWGLGMVSGTPRGNVLATAAEQAKEPFQRYQTAKAKRSAYDQQVGLAAAQSAMEQRDKMAQIAAQTSPDSGLRNIFLEKAINDGYDLPEAQRIADYQLITKSEL